MSAGFDFGFCNSTGPPRTDSLWVPLFGNRRRIYKTRREAPVNRRVRQGLCCCLRHHGTADPTIDRRGLPWASKSDSEISILSYVISKQSAQRPFGRVPPPPPSPFLDPPLFEGNTCQRWQGEWARDKRSTVTDKTAPTTAGHEQNIALALIVLRGSQPAFSGQAPPLPFGHCAFVQDPRPPVLISRRGGWGPERRPLPLVLPPSQSATGRVFCRGTPLPHCPNSSRQFVSGHMAVPSGVRPCRHPPPRTVCGVSQSSPVAAHGIHCTCPRQRSLCGFVWGSAIEIASPAVCAVRLGRTHVERWSQGMWQEAVIRD